jgi:hypothetical protein
MGKEHSSGQTEAATSGTFLRITFMGRECTFGATTANSKDHGLTTKWKV